MKMKLLLIFSLLFITSCIGNKDTEDKQIGKIVAVAPKVEDKQVKTGLTEEKKQEYIDSLNFVIDKGLSSIGFINCEKKYNFSINYYEGEDKEFFEELKEKCLFEQKRVLKERDEKNENRLNKLESFKISDCKSIAEDKFSYFNDLTEEQIIREKTTYESEVFKEQTYCEQGYGFRYGCEKLIDEEKIKLCEENKSFYDKIKEMERYNNFNLGNYLGVN